MNPAEPWTSPAWRDEVERWIDGRLREMNLVRKGAIEQPHVRRWSTVLRVPIPDGDVYFKATLEPSEIMLTEALGRWRPDCMLVPIAVDLNRGWMLMPDGGPRLRENIRSVDDLGLWEGLLTLFADVQQALAARTSELIEMGVPDRRLPMLPSLYEELLEDTAAVRLDRPEGVTGDELSGLMDLRPAIAELCDRLAQVGVPESLHNGDFHDGNVFLNEGHPSLFDWGDACVAHPFFSAVAALRNVEDRFSLAWDGPEIVQLRDIYLSLWTRWGSLEELVRAYETATPLTLICGALGWQRWVRRYPDEFPDHVATWLQELLEMRLGS